MSEPYKHLSTGCEYPDSPCGVGSPSALVYDLTEVTCPECIKILIADAKDILAILEKEDES